MTISDPAETAPPHHPHLERGGPTRMADRAIGDLSRDPLRAGHPVTWGAITAGTVLEGSPFERPRIVRMA